jgi:signal transduction histidine kinase
VAGKDRGPPHLQMQRVRSNTRLGTLIVTTVPVTALVVVVGMGVGASLVACGPVAIVLGLALGAVLAAGIAPASEPAHPGEVHTFGVRALLARAAHDTRPALAGVDVRVDVAPARLRTVGDPECLHRALADLIVHAARRSPPGGMVTLAARSAPHGVRLEVLDEGGGDCRASLAQARRIVGHHGGRLRAERARPHGCRVVVELPGA